MRYIDADALIKKIFPYNVVDKRSYSINAQSVYKAIEESPAADVVPRAEVEELTRENESLAKTVNEASELIRKLRSKVEKSKTEVAREIFEEIEKTLNLSKCYGESGIYFEHDIETDIAELKKKYTEEKKDEKN